MIATCDLERGTWGINLFRQISLITLVTFDKHQISRIRQVGDGHFLAGQSHHHKLARPQHSPFWGFRSVYAHTLWCRTTTSDVLTDVRMGLFLRGQPQSHLKAAEPHRSLILEVPFAFMRTPFVAELPNVQW